MAKPCTCGHGKSFHYDRDCKGGPKGACFFYPDDCACMNYVSQEDAMKTKLDAKFYGEIRKAKDDSIVPPDEYVVFLAKDNAFAAVLPQYLEECHRLRCDPEQIRAVKDMIDRLNKWRDENPTRLKNPDAIGETLLDVSK